MSSSQESPYRTLKAKRPAAGTVMPPTQPGQLGPTTFFLRSERDIEKSGTRGRRSSRTSDREEKAGREESANALPIGTEDSMISDSSYGVQSLEDTISPARSSQHSLSRQSSRSMMEGSIDENAGVLAGRKRKAGNPVHPKILATGQRIISSEYASAHPSNTGSPLSLRSTESPVSTSLRRGSMSSLNLGQPISPFKMSPQPEGAIPSTPRSGSPKSFRLSDEEASVTSDTGSQAIQSSSAEEDTDERTAPSFEPIPELVMPSVSVPQRRPFTERGKRMGRLRVMVAGASGVGKTSLVQSICRVCPDIVHIDPMPTASVAGVGDVVEIGASSRPYPLWWADLDRRRLSLSRSSSGDGPLDRNIVFIDTPGTDLPQYTQKVEDFVMSCSRRATHLEQMTDHEIISMLGGDGGVQVDVILYVFDAVPTPDDPDQMRLVRRLCDWTNVVPLVGKSDLIDADDLATRKSALQEMIKEMQADVCVTARAIETSLLEESARLSTPTEPFAVSSALGDDAETIDASVLMASGYLQPLRPSELSHFVGHLLEPDNIARLRHLSATKIRASQFAIGSRVDLPKQTLLQSPLLDARSLPVTSTGSLLDDPSKILVPYGTNSYYHSIPPSDSDGSANAPSSSSQYAVALNSDHGRSGVELPFRQVRLAKWAHDLQRSLDHERRRYKEMYLHPPSDWTTSSSTESEKQLIHTSSPLPPTFSRPGKGRLGGDLGVIDPRDPLGVLAFTQAFRRRGWFAVQVAGSCGLVGAIVWWVARNWAEVQDFLGLAGPTHMLSVNAVPAPSRPWWEDWKDGLSWLR